MGTKIDNSSVLCVKEDRLAESKAVDKREKTGYSIDTKGATSRSAPPGDYEK